MPYRPVAPQPEPEQPLLILPDDPPPPKEDDGQEDAPDSLLWAQLLICLFLGGLLFFAWRQGGELWGQLRVALRHLLEDGISFSGQEELTRFTDEVRDLLGRLVQAFAPT